MKKFLKYLSILFILPILLFIVNFSTDIQSSANFNKKFVEDLMLYDSLSLKVNLSDRQVVKNRIKYNLNHKKNVVIGSSRSMMFGRPINLNVDNYSMAGAVLKDIENVYDYLKLNKIKIDTVYLEISSWIFNTNAKESRYKDWDSGTSKRKIKKLFSVKYLMDNLRLNKYTKPTDKNNFFKYSDGTIKYSYEFKTQNHLKSIKNFANSEIYHLEGLNSLNNLNTSPLSKLIVKIIEDKSYPIFIKYPYPPLINEYIINKYPNIYITERLVDSISNLYNIKTMGTFYPEDLNITDDDFYDGMHLKPVGLKKLLGINN